MLNQIVLARAVCTHIGNQLANDVQLMEARENQRLAVLAVDELLNDVQRTVLLQHLLPQVGSGIAVRVGRITLAAVVASAVAALVEGQEERITLVQACGHEHIGVVNAEVRQDALLLLLSARPNHER